MSPKTAPNRIPTKFRTAPFMAYPLTKYNNFSRHKRGVKPQLCSPAATGRTLVETMEVCQLKGIYSIVDRPQVGLLCRRSIYSLRCCRQPVAATVWLERRA